MLYFGQRQFPKSRKVFLTFMSTYEDQDQGPDNGELEAHVSSSVKGVTLQDVAHAAGVTIGTASKAINGRGKLSLETRERVRNEARRLGFRFRDLEQNVSVDRRAMIGILTSDIYGRFSLPLLMGIEQAFVTRPGAVLCATSDQAQEEAHFKCCWSAK